MRNKIFINYRREGTTETAGRLYDQMAQAFGHENLFVDFLGADLKARLTNQVPMCQAFLTVIGPSWLDAKDEAGRRRIHSRDDFVLTGMPRHWSNEYAKCPIKKLSDTAGGERARWRVGRSRPC